VKRSTEYLLELSAAMADRYVGDCLEHARNIREQLIAEGCEAWIGRLRKTEKIGDSTFHGPLIPLRFRGRSGPTWTTHYVCCAEGAAYDPLAGVPVPLDVYSMRVFGEEITIEPVDDRRI
jgi:hypothetical protein